MRLITLTLKSGRKVYINPAHIVTISECFDGEETIVAFIGGDNAYIKVLESAESVTKMVEGEQNG